MSAVFIRVNSERLSQAVRYFCRSKLDLWSRSRLQGVQKVSVRRCNAQSRHCFASDGRGGVTSQLMLCQPVCCFNCVLAKDFHRTVISRIVLFSVLTIAVLFVCDSICLTVVYILRIRHVQSPTNVDSWAAQGLEAPPKSSTSHLATDLKADLQPLNQGLNSTCPG